MVIKIYLNWKRKTINSNTSKSLKIKSLKFRGGGGMKVLEFVKIKRKIFSKGFRRKNVSSSCLGVPKFKIQNAVIKKYQIVTLNTGTSC